MSEITRSVRITGRVQGVSFRAWTQGQARAKGLTGWVRNEDDGAVTALFQGPEAAVQEMLDECWSGPGAARVQDVRSAPAEPVSPDGFEIRG